MNNYTVPSNFYGSLSKNYAYQDLINYLRKQNLSNEEINQFLKTKNISSNTKQKVIKDLMKEIMNNNPVSSDFTKGPNKNPAYQDLINYLLKQDLSNEEINQFFKRKNISSDTKQKVIKNLMKEVIANNNGDIRSVLGIGNKELSEDLNTKDFLSDLQEQAYKDQVGLMTDPNSKLAQQYKGDMYSSIDKEQDLSESLLNSAEMEAYKMIGQKQLELENSIAEQRTKALKAGTTSAQLASMQLANMFASQSGAAEVASGLINTKVQNRQNYMSQKTNVLSGLYEQVNSNKQALLTSGAQNFASSSAYASYINQQIAALAANQKYMNQYGKEAYKTTFLKDEK